MATKKATSATKKSTAKKPAVSTAKTTTKVTTVQATSTAKSTSSLFGLPLSRAPFLGALIAEFFGTFLLVAAIIAGQGQPIVVMFALVGIVLLVGGLSGAHVNPAITIGAWATRKIKGARALGYIVAQVLGALLAFVVLSAFVNGAAHVSPEAAAYGQQAATLFQAVALPEGKEWFAFFAEVLGMLILGFAVSSALREKKDRTAAAFTVGLGIFVALLVAGSAAAFVGASTVINPAAALALGTIDWGSIHFWPIAVYFIAPLLGGILGFVLQDVLRVESDGGDDKLVA